MDAEVPMIGPLQNLGNNSAASQSADSLRADLLTAPPQSATEIPNKAVGGIADNQALPTELPSHIHEVANQIGQVESEYKALQEKAQRSRELDELRSRLLLGKKQVNAGDLSSSLAKSALSEVSQMGSRVNSDASYDATDIVQQKKHALPAAKNVQQKDNNVAGLDDQQNVILRIDDALSVLNNIIDKIDSEKSESTNKLLNLTGSISGLNAARNTVDKTKLSLNVASNAVDMIMTNIRTAIFAHGKVSNDIVRLVLA